MEERCGWEGTSINGGIRATFIAKSIGALELGEKYPLPRWHWQKLGVCCRSFSRILNKQLHYTNISINLNKSSETLSLL